ALGSPGSLPISPSELVIQCRTSKMSSFFPPNNQRHKPGYSGFLDHHRTCSAHPSIELSSAKPLPAPSARGRSDELPDCQYLHCHRPTASASCSENGSW